MVEDVPMAVKCAIVEFLKAIDDKKCAVFTIKGNLINGDVSIEIEQGFVEDDICKPE